MGKTAPLKAVLFDLDGTLLDTAPDLASACNAAALEAGLRATPLQDLKPCVSGGAMAMMRLALAQNDSALPIEPLLARMLELYEQNIAVHTRFFDGVETVLDELEERGLAWGIVTNKIARFTDPLLRALNLAERPACVISGDTCTESKPHPRPMLEACRRIGRAPETCVYIGDARRDIEAGQNAGMSTLAALYGYVPTDDPADRWGAQGLLGRPGELLDWLDQHA